MNITTRDSKPPQLQDTASVSINPSDDIEEKETTAKFLSAKKKRKLYNVLWLVFLLAMFPKLFIPFSLVIQLLTTIALFVLSSLFLVLKTTATGEMERQKAFLLKLSADKLRVAMKAFRMSMDEPSNG